MSKQERLNTRVVTGIVRFSYVHVFEPEQMEGETKAKYKASLIIPKDDTETIAKIEKAIENAKLNAKDKTWKGKIPAKLDICLRDGDVDKEDDDVYAGSMFINAKSDKQPGIVNEKVQPIMDQEDFYSGCYGRAAITFYGYDAGGNKGVAAILDNVMKTKDGEPLGGKRPDAEDDFADFVDDLM